MHLQQRILVTGGSGFLGSHLCVSLFADGANVICLDNFFTGSRSNIVHLLDNKHFELIRHDVTFPIYLEIDQIYNLGCPASPIHYQHDPVQTTKTSVHGAINMLGLAKRVKAKIFQASTSEVYGDPSVHPQTEDYWGNVNPIGARSKIVRRPLPEDDPKQRRPDISRAQEFLSWAPRTPLKEGLHSNHRLF
jgi:UDP-glucuronate decarboxylase